MPFLCRSCQLQTDFIDRPPCEPNCSKFQPSKTVMVHLAIRKNKSYVIACLQNTANPKSFLPISNTISAVTCSRCKLVAKEMAEKELKNNPSPPEIDATWDNATWEVFGYPQELVILLNEKGWTPSTLHNALLRGTDIKTISEEYADIILASFNLGNK